MTKLIKRVIPSLLLAVIFMFTSFSGCSYTPSTMPWTGLSPENLTEQQWQDILSVALEYHYHLEDYKLIMTTSVSTEVVGGSNPWTRSLSTTISGIRDMTENKAQITKNISMMMEGMGQTGEEQAVYYDIYAENNWLYISMVTVDVGSYWLRVKRSGELEEFFSFGAAEQQTKTLDSVTNIEYLRTESINNVDCYVLSITLDNDALANWLDLQDTGFQNVDWQKVINESNALNDFNLYCYLAKDSDLIMRISMNMAMELTPEQVETTSTDFDKVTLGLSMDIVLYDHNIPYDLTLPEGAYSATEVSSDIFLD